MSSMSSGEICVDLDSVDKAVAAPRELAGATSSNASIDLGITRSKGATKDAMERVAARLGELAAALSAAMERTASLVEAGGVRFREGDESLARGLARVGGEAPGPTGRPGPRWGAAS
ncbi:MAG: hypothetical protein MR611_06585 [Coriobacteriaceae bacterium]|nr:hypothetical protein [Coriobacteriaceae bacterium]